VTIGGTPGNSSWHPGWEPCSRESRIIWMIPKKNVQTSFLFSKSGNFCPMRLFWNVGSTINKSYLKQVAFPWQGGSLQRKSVELNGFFRLKGLLKVTPMQYPSESVLKVRFFGPSAARMWKIVSFPLTLMIKVNFVLWGQSNYAWNFLVIFLTPLPLPHPFLSSMRIRKTRIPSIESKALHSELVSNIQVRFRVGTIFAQNKKFDFGTI
jgi:hypothetical protein